MTGNDGTFGTHTHTRRYNNIFSPVAAFAVMFECVLPHRLLAVQARSVISSLARLVTFGSSTCVGVGYLLVGDLANGIDVLSLAYGRQLRFFVATLKFLLSVLCCADCVCTRNLRILRLWRKKISSLASSVLCTSMFMYSTQMQPKSTCI